MPELEVPFQVPALIDKEWVWGLSESNRLVLFDALQAVGIQHDHATQVVIEETGRMIATMNHHAPRPHQVKDCPERPASALADLGPDDVCQYQLVIP